MSVKSVLSTLAGVAVGAAAARVQDLEARVGKRRDSIKDLDDRERSLLGDVVALDASADELAVIPGKRAALGQEVGVLSRALDAARAALAEARKSAEVAAAEKVFVKVEKGMEEVSAQVRDAARALGAALSRARQLDDEVNPARAVLGKTNMEPRVDIGEILTALRAEVAAGSVRPDGRDITSVDLSIPFRILP